LPDITLLSFDGGVFFCLRKAALQASLPPQKERVKALIARARKSAVE